MALSIASIVEGHGEVQALPVLLRRFQSIANPPEPVDIQPPIRMHSESFFDLEKLARYLQIASADPADRHLILLVRDADEACPVQVSARIQGLLRDHAHLNILTVVTQTEYESWFLAAIPSIAGTRKLPSNLVRPENHDSIRGAKEWLSRHMGTSACYSETIDQPAFSATIDLDQARENPSFRRFQDRVLAFLRGD